jgi:hypothetical protein
MKWRYDDAVKKTALCGVSVSRVILRQPSSVLSEVRLAIHNHGILKTILSDIGAMLDRGIHPHIIFDLDDTVFDAGSRTKHILMDVARRLDVAERDPRFLATLEALSIDQIRYRVEDNLDLLGVQDAFVRDVAQTVWWERFFNTCEIDEVVPGAPAFVQSVHAAGATVIYLTGRDRLRMEAGTHASLDRHGFPRGERARLILKPDKSQCDFRFKREEVAGICTSDVVVAAFDNEPRHVNMLREALPEAHVVFVDRRHAGHPEQPVDSVIWIRDFT